MLQIDPAQSLRQAREPSESDEVFEIFFGSQGGANKAIKMEGGLGWKPATDVYETEREFIIQIDLAGVGQEDLDVLIDEEYVTIRGVRRNVLSEGKKHFHKMEIMVGPFERHVRIPANVDSSSVSARYESGFLFVRMNLGEGQRESRRIIRIDG
jgi:HSP20 family molecular chaperone IbpA